MYVNVIVPVPLEPSFTYRVPDEMAERVKVGSRVTVPFGRGRFYTAIVESILPVKPQTRFEIKDVVDVPDTEPVLRHPQMKLWDWISDYYLCSRGDVMRAALPAGLKVESETSVEVNPDMEAEDAAAILTPRELQIWQTLKVNGRTKLDILGRDTEVKNIGSVAQKMLDKGAVVISEKILERFRPKRETFVEPAFERGNAEALRTAFESMSRAPRREKALMTLLEMSAFMHPERPQQPVPRRELMERAGVTTETVRQLEQKGLVRTFAREVSRFSSDIKGSGVRPTLSPAQQTALNELLDSCRTKKVTLLHGVTASGKTEIYMHLIDKVLRDGRQVLYLVPEIALTTQLTERIRRVFGDKVLIYHSRFTDNQRAEIWRMMLRDNAPRIIIGARSAVFLPFAQLGLVIVDEEHESSYKQFDPAPRYNARDVAIVLAGMHGARTVLGSATPTVETYYKAQTGKFGLVELTERYTHVQLPTIEVVDMNREFQRRAIQGAFAELTVDAAREALRDSGQVIVFHNRRGFAPMSRCKACAHIPHCDNCDVSLTYHRAFDKLVCHYCGAVYDVPRICPVCHEPAMEVVGFGTERVEDDVARFFPKARMLRMDLDTTRNKDDYSRIIDTFSAHKADILVGTQMVTKGLDFADVSLVAVLSADLIINYPDFRAAERAFNMLEQVAGRAGRQQKPGRVMVQTRQPEHPVIQLLKEHDYQGFYRHELEERRAYNYPPFARIIYVNVRHRDAARIQAVANRYAEHLRMLFGNRVFGPEEPYVSRIQNQYIRKIMLKIEPTVAMNAVRDALRSAYQTLLSMPDMNGTTVFYDVDPQ